jgi:hypothetical protein
MEDWKISFLAGYITALEHLEKSYQSHPYFDLALRDTAERVGEYKKIFEGV